MVIARGSSFKFRSQGTDLNDIAALSVRYVLDGTMEVIGDRLAIAVELSDCRTGEVIWAERYHPPGHGMHQMRAEIVAGIVSALETHIQMCIRGSVWGVGEHRRETSATAM